MLPSPSPPSFFSRRPSARLKAASGGLGSICATRPRKSPSASRVFSLFAVETRWSSANPQTPKPYDPNCLQNLLAGYKSDTNALIQNMRSATSANATTPGKVIKDGLIGATKMNVAKQAGRSLLGWLGAFGGLANFLKVTPPGLAVSFSVNAAESLGGTVYGDYKIQNQFDSAHEQLRNELYRRAKDDCGLAVSK